MTEGSVQIPLSVYETFLMRRKAFPLRREGPILLVAAPEPLDDHTVENLEQILHCRLEVKLVSEQGLEPVLEQNGILGDELLKLERTAREPDLVAKITLPLAAIFGVIPLEEAGPRLCVASGRSTSPSALDVLAKILDRPLDPVACEDWVISYYLNRIYLGGQPFDLPTFLEEDFLRKPVNWPLLTRQKECKPPSGPSLLPPDLVAALDLSYRSVMQNVDHPHEPEFQSIGADGVPFVFFGDRLLLSRGPCLDPQVQLLAKESFSYAGCEHFTGFSGHEIREFPFFIHPSEVQVLSVGKEGDLELYLYDKVERVKPDGPRTWKLSYYFLSAGRQYRRELTIRIHGLCAVPRKCLVYLGRKISASSDPQDFKRWQGQDLSG